MVEGDPRIEFGVEMSNQQQLKLLPTLILGDSKKTPVLLFVLLV